MTPVPEHGTPAADAFLALRQLARRTDADVQEVLTLYALEGLLARVAASKWADEFVLKGGVLLAAFDLRRPTKDIDLQATGLPNDVEAVRERMTAIAAVGVSDGLVFPADEVTAQTIRDEDQYAGVRVRLVAGLANARLTIGVDINFGDPIWPGAETVTIPRLLGSGPVRMLGYPLPMVVAEKTLTAIERGEANTRWRDFADLLIISRSQTFAAAEVVAAVAEVAAHRGVPSIPLRSHLADLPAQAQPKWAVWRRKQATADQLPASFAEALDEIADFVDPILGTTVDEGSGWDHQRRSWS
ncbi:nucleotidyl transferase AbiEii/AbiGii toxin family protein [Kribbella sp. NPDC051770]|uniref:nucleotidyl transferase AbiEii/AbiGii toxin family protein n=1 Tax=Kribbella sp. NPDC051770 TaxID=3155413 RepID=UPI003432E180